jgi:hypothetical protein
MNYSIREDKLNKLIYRTIDKIIDKDAIKSTPNLGFATDDVVTKMNYHNDNFDEFFAIYFDNHFGEKSRLRNATPLLLPDDDNVTPILTDLFGDRWYPVFFRWVKDNFNDKVKSFMQPKLNQPIFFDK